MLLGPSLPLFSPSLNSIALSATLTAYAGMLKASCSGEAATPLYVAGSYCAGKDNWSHWAVQELWGAVLHEAGTSRAAAGPAPSLGGVYPN